MKFDEVEIRKLVAKAVERGWATYPPGHRPHWSDLSAQEKTPAAPPPPPPEAAPVETQSTPPPGT